MIAPSRRTPLRARFAIVLLTAFALAAASCSLVGQGDLHVANDLSGIGADNTTLRAFAPGTGDVFPPPGWLNLFVKGDDFGKPPAYGMNGYLYLVRTGLDCPESEGAPESFTLAQVTITGLVTVTNGSVNQFLLMQDTPANRESHWALIEINELDGYPGEHFIHRCGEVAWTGTSALLDPCTLRTAISGQALAGGKAFALDADTKWQFCYGGAAAGSNEKFLFYTDTGGATWALISRTTLGDPPAEAGVGELPNGIGVSAFFFQDTDKAWLGLSSPGHNLLRSSDGGHNWFEVVVPDLEPGVPVEFVTFTTSLSGYFNTPDGTWATADGGVNWSKSP